MSGTDRNTSKIAPSVYAITLETLRASPRKIPIKDPMLIAQNDIQRVLKAASPRYNKSLILNPEKYVEADPMKNTLILKKT